MKRRGFLGLMGGAAVAGPGMVKQAAAAAVGGLETLAVPGAAMLGDVGYAQSAVPWGVQGTKATLDGAGILAKLAGLTADQRRRAKNQMHVSALDPDIASYRSIALHAKIDWQKERQFNRMLEQRKSMWTRHVAGIFGPDEDDIWNYL